MTDVMDAAEPPSGEGPVTPRRRGRRAVLWGVSAVGAVFAVFAGVLALGLGDEPQYRGTALLGKPAPDLVLTTFDGEEFPIVRDDGRAVIVNFWNSWCIPCREEEPALQAFYAAHADDPAFAMIGIVRDDNLRDARKWVDDHDTPWPVAMDPGARAAIDFGTAGQPETYAVSPDGVLVAKHLGRATVEDLERLLAVARGERLEEVR